MTATKKKITAPSRGASLVDALDLQSVVDAKTDAELAHGLSDASALQSTPFAHLQQLRVLAFPRLAAEIKDPGGAMAAWAARMEEQTGSETVTLKPGTPFAYDLPWLAAFAVVHKGEAPAHWPTAWNEGHLARADQWAGGENIPGIVSGRASISAPLT